MPNQPLVSVIIPTYNCEKYICNAINSVLDQTYPNIEIIVINDGSTDDTVSLIKKVFQNKITVVSQPNKGVASARNIGIHYFAKGEYIAMLDADDILLPEKIEESIRILTESNTYSAVLSNCFTISQGQTDILFDDKMPSYIDLRYVLKNTLALSNIVIPTEIIRSLRGYDTSLHIGEDYDLLLRITDACGPIYYIDRPLAIINKRTGSLSSKYKIDYRIALNKIYKKLSMSWIKRLFYANYHFAKYTAYILKNKIKVGT